MSTKNFQMIAKLCSQARLRLRSY